MHETLYTEKRHPKPHRGGGTKELEKRLTAVEQSRGSETAYGLVSLSDSPAVTDSAGKALPTSENNAGLPGTMANRIAANKKELEKKQRFYPSLESLGITSTFLPYIMRAMPKHSVFRTIVNGTGIYDDAENKIPMHAGVISIEKTESYCRILFTHTTTGGTNGKLYIGSVDTNTGAVIGWYELDGTLLNAGKE